MFGIGNKSSLVQETAAHDDKFYFVDTDVVNGAELRELDLLTNSVSLVADINPGFGDAFIEQFGIGIIGDSLYFTAYDPTHGNELRVLDTTSNTFSTIDIYPGTESSDAGRHGGFVVIGTKLYFSANDPTMGQELRVWNSLLGTDPEELLPDRWLKRNPNHRWNIADQREKERQKIAS